MMLIHKALAADNGSLQKSAKTSHRANKCGSGALVIQSGPLSKHIIPTTVLIYITHLYNGSKAKCSTLTHVSALRTISLQFLLNSTLFTSQLSLYISVLEARFIAPYSCTIEPHTYRFTYWLN